MTQAQGRQLSNKNRRITKIYTKSLKALAQKAGVHKGIERTLLRLKEKPDKGRHTLLPEQAKEI